MVAMSSSIKIMSAASFATSEPEIPIATPMSAACLRHGITDETRTGKVPVASRCAKTSSPTTAVVHRVRLLLKTPKFSIDKLHTRESAGCPASTAKASSTCLARVSSREEPQQQPKHAQRRWCIPTNIPTQGRRQLRDGSKSVSPSGRARR